MSKTLDEPTKEKIRPLLNVDYMSSDESEVVVAATRSRAEVSSDSESEAASVGKKRLHRHRLPWRSQELLSLKALNEGVAIVQKLCVWKL